MATTTDQPDLRPDLINKLREVARRGAGVRELTAIIQNRLDFPKDAVIPVLAAFTRAFHLPLRKALPIREWLGTDNDAEIDALILPEIVATKHKWMSDDGRGNGERSADGSVQECDQATLKK